MSGGGIGLGVLMRAEAHESMYEVLPREDGGSDGLGRWGAREEAACHVLR